MSSGKLGIGTLLLLIGIGGLLGNFRMVVLAFFGVPEGIGALVVVLIGILGGGYLLYKGFKEK